MTQWFFEIRSGEIPALMQHQACQQLETLLATLLSHHHLSYKQIQTFVTPTRLGACVEGLPLNQQDSQEERRGPRTDAPQLAVNGFLASVSVDLNQLEKRQTDKGEFYFHILNKKGQQTQDIIPLLMQQVLDQLSWPKSMMWQYSQKSWIRPINGGCCVFNNQPINFQFKINDQQSICFDNQTIGHRFLNNEKVVVTDFENYQQQLLQHHIVIDPALRRHMIMTQIEALCAQHNLVLEQDEGLLNEVTGLVEYPFVYLGEIPPGFMTLPHEVLKTSMRVHQRYFSVRDQKGNFAPHFIIVANIPGKDKGQTLITGNARVLNARLSDAQFFFNQDQKILLLKQSEQLSTLVFHRKLGTLTQKVMRVKNIVRQLNFDCVSIEKLMTIAELAKSDLLSHMVGEFPELQGIMGAKYAELQGYDAGICQAIYDQYLPRGGQDRLPQHKLSQWYGLIERIDTLVGFFLVDIHPTGSKDPFALRRTALSIIRIMEDNLQFDLNHLFTVSIGVYREQIPTAEFVEDALCLNTLIAFISERLKVYWRDQHHDIDQIQAVLNLDSAHNIFDMKKRLVALQQFKANDVNDYTAMIAMYKRIHNIMQQQSILNQTIEIDPGHFEHDIESKLYELSADISHKLSTQGDHYSDTLKLLTTYKRTINDFFDYVMINSDDQHKRSNRLGLLKLIYNQLKNVADFSKLDG